MDVHDVSPHYESQQVAYGVAVAVACASFALRTIATGQLTWTAVIVAIAWGGVAWGITYAIGVVIGLLRPRAASRATPHTPHADDLEEADYDDYDSGSEPEYGAIPEWREHLSRHVIGNYLRVGNTSTILPNALRKEWLYIVAKERWHGRLPSVSARALDAIGISRFGNGNEPPAVLVIALLEKTNLIRSGGVQRPYFWTESGERVFPLSPTLQSGNGRTHSGTRPTTAAATADHRPPPPQWGGEVN